MLRDNGWTIEALVELHAENEVQPVIPRSFTLCTAEACGAHQANLAQGQPHLLPSVSIPIRPPCIKEDMDDITSATTVASVYRPRGIIHLVPEGYEGSGHDRQPIERIIVQEYTLDILHSWVIL